MIYLQSPGLLLERMRPQKSVEQGSKIYQLILKQHILKKLMIETNYTISIGYSQKN